MFFSFLFINCLSKQKFPINKKCDVNDSIYDCSEMLICAKNNNTCQFCTTDEQCQSVSVNHINYFCEKSPHYNHKVCTYKPFGHKFRAPHIVGSIFIFILGTIVSLSGIDGGLIFIPLLISCFFPPFKYIQSLSSSLLCGNSFASFLMNLFRKHQIYQRPLINYNVVALFEPLSWVGTIFGVMLCSILPNWVILCVILIFTIFASIFYFVIGVRRNMKKYKKHFLFSEAELVSYPSPYLGPAYSRFLVLALFHLWIVFMLFPFLRGGDRLPSIAYFDSCSTPYWLVTLLPLVIYFLFESFVIKSVKSYPVLGESAEVGLCDYLLIPFLSCLSGVFSSLLGFNGELIKGHYLSLLRLDPEEFHATSQMMMFFTSSVTSVQYIAKGVLDFKVFLILAGFQIIPSIIGNILNRKLKDRLNVKGKLMIAVAVFCLIGFGTTLFFTYEDLKDAIKDNNHFKIYDLCLI